MHQHLLIDTKLQKKKVEVNPIIKYSGRLNSHPAPVMTIDFGLLEYKHIHQLIISCISIEMFKKKTCFKLEISLITNTSTVNHLLLTNLLEVTSFLYIPD